MVCFACHVKQTHTEEFFLLLAHPYVAFQNHTGEALLPEWTNRDASSKSHKFYVDRSKGDRRFNRRADEVDSDSSNVEMRERKSSVVESEDVVFFSNWNTALVVQVCVFCSLAFVFFSFSF